MEEEGELSQSDHLPAELVRLGTFKWPRSDTRQTLGQLYEKILRNLRRGGDQNAIGQDELELLSDNAVEQGVKDFLTRTLKKLLDEQYLEWAQSSSSVPSRRMFVHPPMEGALLLDWARERELPIVDQTQGLSGISDAPCVILPRLDSFFRRDIEKLRELADVLDALRSFKGKVLCGCNSWALRFLRQFDDVILSLGDADTIPAFDKNALAAIFETASDGQNVFTSVASGKPILKRNSDGELCDPFLEKLAGRSLGHPWVAVAMFFQGIAETRDKEEDRSDNCVWVSLPNSCSIPEPAADVLQFALHALLIHGTRDIKELNDLLPYRTPHGTWQELERAGFVTIEDGSVYCNMVNYPDIRSELGAAGFNLDEL